MESREDSNRMLLSTVPPSSGALSALGSFIWQDRARVLAAAARGEEGQTIVECELRGASMACAIPAGSRIRIDFSRRPYRRGDVIAFMIDAQVVVHRIVYRHRGWRRGDDAMFFITRGDAMILPDAPIDARAVLGSVGEMRTEAEWVAIGAQKHLPRRDRLLALLVLVPIALLVHLRVSAARKFTNWLHATDRRLSWTRRLLY